MLFHLQFPFTDLRNFLHETSPRIPVPAWPSPIPFEEFVRFFGEVRQRPNGGLTGWIAESEYCEATRAIVFPPGALNPWMTTNKPSYEYYNPWRVAFRRLYFDGYASGKIELGLKRRFCDDTLPLDALLLQVLNFPAAVRVITGEIERRPLHECTKSLVKLYEQASSTSVEGKTQLGPTGVVLAENPIVFLELWPHEGVRAKKPSYARKLSVATSQDFDLFFWRAKIRGRVMGVWCAERKKYGNNSDLREIRVRLLRLNSDNQSFKRVLKAIGTGLISPSPRSEKAELLQNYLETARHRIGKSEKKAEHYADETARYAYSLFDAATQGERDSLIERLRVIDVRPTLIRKINQYAITVETGGKFGEAMAAKVFISYRRDDARYQARMIHSAFCKAIPSDHVFMDVNSIPPGANFRKILKDWVDKCDVLLALIGPGWIDARDPKTKGRRVDNESDFVRIEIGEALARGIPVVPVLLDGASMPDVELLPDDLKELLDRQAEFVEYRTFDADVEHLLRRLSQGVGRADFT